MAVKQCLHFGGHMEKKGKKIILLVMLVRTNLSL